MPRALRRDAVYISRQKTEEKMKSLNGITKRNCSQIMRSAQSRTGTTSRHFLCIVSKCSHSRIPCTHTTPQQCAFTALKQLNYRARAQWVTSASLCTCHMCMCCVLRAKYWVTLAPLSQGINIFSLTSFSNRETIQAKNEKNRWQFGKQCGERVRNAG